MAGEGQMTKPKEPPKTTVQALLQHGKIHVSLDVSAEQFFELLAQMGSVKVSGGAVADMLDLDEVVRRVPVSKSTIKRLISSGNFPKGRYISPNRRVWTEDEIQRWQKSLSGKTMRKNGNGNSAPHKKAAPRKAKKRARVMR
jgi:predicted DNA-binding transcriptional regulator AlpA